MGSLRPAGEKSAAAFRTISEVSRELGVPQHVLRFWETRFSQIRPVKRGGGRRYYRREDIELLQRIRLLLHEQGYTIKGVQKLLKERRDLGADVQPVAPEEPGEDTTAHGLPIAVIPPQEAVTTKQEAMRSLLQDLKQLRDLLVKTGG
jgi:DNA-binding transcriptional MerR regulator